MACATLTILLVPTTTPRGAESVSCRLFVVKIWVAVLASKMETAQHGLRYSNNSPGAHNDASRCQVGQLSSLRGENLVAVLASKAKTAQHGLRYSNNSPGAHNDATRCQVGQLSPLRGENLVVLASKVKTLAMPYSNNTPDAHNYSPLCQ